MKLQQFIHWDSYILLGISILMLSAFVSFPKFLSDPLNLAYYLALMVPSYGLREYLHLRAAKKLGHEASYALWWPGLIAGAFTALFSNGLLRFLVPGFVVIKNGIKKDGMLQFGYAGIKANLAFLIAASFIDSPIARDFAILNALFSFISLIPIKPFYGEYIFKGSVPIWLLTFIITLFFFWANMAGITADQLVQLFTNLSGLFMLALVLLLMIAMLAGFLGIRKE
ncbi:MAG: hypothetical protein HYX24_06615 [Candidatus Aenigmarchaeota archaeon]|nr:hypothetical protein [Candidatus Aenigmarchaeota archaeon]